MNIEDRPGDEVADTHGRLLRAAAELRAIAMRLSEDYAWVPEQGRVNLDKVALDACIDVAALADIIRAFGMGDKRHAARIKVAPSREGWGAQIQKASWDMARRDKQ